jgi:agmatine deiminase
VRYLLFPFLIAVSLGGASLAFPKPPIVSPACPAPCDLRVAAEWEPVIGVLIGWPLQLPPSLVIALGHDVDLYVTVGNARNEERARKSFAAWGIDLSRVHFLHTTQGTGYYITRDWGPFAVFDGQGNYRLVDSRYLDYPFSSARGKHLLWMPRSLGFNYRPDDQAPLAVARHLCCPRIELPIALTGGNVFFDGQGTALSTQLMLDENRAKGFSKQQFLDIVREGFGVHTFHFLPNFERLGIQHLDCLIKLLDEERILVKRPPADHALYKNIETVVCHLSRLTNGYGRPYQILRIDTPPYLLHKLANYTNSLIVNRKIYVPMFGIPADATALQTWRDLMPGYEVLGFEHKGWSFADSLHCRVRGIWDPKMLYLTHRRPDAHAVWCSRFPLVLQARDYSGAGLIAEQLLLVWRPQGQARWNKVRLQPHGDAHHFVGHIEGTQPGQRLEYYFSAVSRSGKAETLPRTAPAGVYSFCLE